MSKQRKEYCSCPRIPTHQDNAFWLASVDTSGAGLRWLTSSYSEDLSISDDGSRFAFQLIDDYDDHLGTISTSGGSVIDLDQSTGLPLISSGAGISLDGNTIAAVYLDGLDTIPSDTELVIINADFGTIQKKVSTWMKIYPNTDLPQFTPDSRHIVFQGGTADGSQQDLYIMKTDGSDLRNLTQTDMVIESLFLVR